MFLDIFSVIYLKLRFFMSYFKFSVIKIFDNDILTFDEFITSMINQKLDFKKNNI